MPILLTRFQVLVAHRAQFTRIRWHGEDIHDHLVQASAPAIALGLDLVVDTVPGADPVLPRRFPDEQQIIVQIGQIGRYIALDIIGIR